MIKVKEKSMKKFNYNLLGLVVLISNLSSAVEHSASVIGKAKNLQGAISACAGKKGGDSCFTTPVSKDGRYSAMVAMLGACTLGKVDFEEEKIQASVLVCQPKRTPVSSTQDSPQVVKSDAEGVAAQVNPPAEIFNK
jgi:hypothetical protein